MASACRHGVIVTKLTDREVIGLIREEYKKKVQEVFDELDVFVKLGSMGEINVLSPGLKIREKKSGLLYTIISVKLDVDDGDDRHGGGVDVVSAEGEKFFIKNSELRARYALD